MDIWSWLQEVAILIVVYEITAAESDLLESFRPKEENPPELNEFLSNVLQHKNDFYFVKQSARKYQKMKKDTQDANVFDPLSINFDYYNTLDDKYKMNDKRFIHHHAGNRRFRNFDSAQPSNQRNKFRRSRRGVKKRTAEPIMEKSEEENNIQKRMPTLIMLQDDDDAVKKRMPAVIMAAPAVQTKAKKHIPSQIFVEPQGEQIQKRTPDEIVVESEAEKGNIEVYDEILPKQKKQAVDMTNPVHRTYKPVKGMRNEMRNNKESDFYYVDLENGGERNLDRYNDRRRYGWSPRRSNYYRRPDSNRIYNRPFRGRPKQEPLDYPQYETGPHHTLSDEVAFEKALSYELEPRYRGAPEGRNNPAGNNLYSVDEGPPDTFQPFYPQEGYQSKLQNMDEFEYPVHEPHGMTNERFYVDADNHLQKIDTTSTQGTTTGTTATTKANEEKKVEHVGNGFIEISKTRRESEGDDALLAKESLADPKEDVDILSDKVDEEEEKETVNKEKGQSPILLKHSLHPLRIKDTKHEEEDEKSPLTLQETVQDENQFHTLEKRDVTDDTDKGERFQSRKLQFIDDAMTNFYDQNEDYEEIPNRPRRDFLDALGMKNEEDYSEDNPYKDMINVNNTDIHNDTYIHNSSHNACGTTTVKPRYHQKEDLKNDFNNIKTILEEPKEITDGTVTADFKKPKDKKRAQKRFSEDFDDFDDMLESNEVRKARGANKDIETKIFENKDKIYNVHEDTRNRNVINNHVAIRQNRNLPKWDEESQKLNKNNVKKSVMSAASLASLASVATHHKINKKEDSDVAEVASASTVAPLNWTEPENVNSTYEQVAHQMDVENEKLAQVVNGHLASKIVSTVFDELKKKNSLKTKFYSGLSRKHVNFAGTIDFDIFKANETEDVDEARLLLDQITKVLNKLVLNQIRRKLCQRLPDELKDYLDIVLNVKNNLETISFVPNTQQGDFLFTYQDKKEPPFDVRKLQNTLVELESLLLGYHNMNEDCQSRAEPVKDYIEKHIKMLKQIVNCPTHTCEDKLSETKRNTPTLINALVEKQLESVGLGKSHEFVPNFDLNQLIKNKLKDNGWKSDKKRDLQKRSSSYKSQQYRRLQLAAEKVREKRENEKKIAELFGSKKKRSVKKFGVDYEEPVVYSLG